jgi:hypothetical protein
VRKTDNICIDCKVNEKYPKASRCRECAAIDKKIKYHADPIAKRAMLSAQCKWRYGIGFDDIDRIVREQDGCAICHTMTPGGKGWNVDHDHSCCPSNVVTCGKCIRGVLCIGCNLALGGFRDRIDLLEGAIDYLKEGIKA